MNIAITGSTGFVGVNLLDYLKDNDITQISRTTVKTKKTINYSQLDETFWNTTEAFIHLAGKAHDLKKTSDDKEYFEVNTELTKLLFDQFLKSNCEVFVYISSVKAVADNVEGVLSEAAIPNPVTVYGKSKLEAEKYIMSKEIPKNKRVYILRPCMIHGPNNKGNLNLLYSFVSKGIPYPFGKFENQRSFLSVYNLCFVIRELVENKTIDSGIYNISDNQTLSTKQLVKTMSEVINKPSRIWNIPIYIVEFIAKLGDVFSLPINSERLKKMTENYRVSNKKIITSLGKELPLSAEEGIKKTIKSFQKNGQ